MLNGAIWLVEFYFITIHPPSDYDQCVMATMLGKPPHHLGTCPPTHLAACWECILSVSSLVLCPKHRPIQIFAVLKWSKWSKIKGSGHIIMCLLLVNKSNRETFTTMANLESLVALSLWTLTNFVTYNRTKWVVQQQVNLVWPLIWALRLQVTRHIPKQIKHVLKWHT